MSSLRELHEQAMSFVDMALMARRDGRPDEATKFFALAFEAERTAALLLKDRGADAEPTRSILLRSAATLALDCGELREAERLSAIALSGEPPEEIAEELRDVLDRANFGRHLQVKGVSLEEGDMQLSLHGNAVAPGFAPSTVAFTRIQAAERAYFRTAERKAGASYDSHANRQIRRDYETFVSIPRAASFAVSFRFGRIQSHLLPGLSPTELLDDLLECLELFNRGDGEALHRKIRDEHYYRNFVGLARQLAPDGSGIKLVGITAQINGQEKSVSLTTSRLNSVSLYPRDGDDHPDHHPIRHVTIKGTLRAASKTRGNYIKVIDNDGKAHKVIVPAELMSDIVRPLWDMEVTVTGTQRNNSIMLEHIDRVR